MKACQRLESEGTNRSKGISEMIASRKWVGVLLILACMLAGCSSPEREMLIGQWQIEKAGKLMNRIGKGPAGSPADDLATMADNQMRLVFHRNGKLETVTQMGSIDRKKAGTWELLEFENADQTSLIRCTLNGQTTEHEIVWLANGNLKMVPPNMAGTLTKLEFRRAD